MENRFYLQLEEEIKTETEKNFKDEEILEKSLENPRFFEFFVDKYQKSFLRTATRVLKNKEESEEAVQDAFVKIYLNVKKYQKQPGVELKSWAYKVLLNCVFTKYRKTKKTLADSEYFDELLYDTPDSSQSFVEKKEKKDEIESVLKELPEDLSELLKQHYLEDKPYAEIANTKGMSMAALKMKLFRARKKFKETMEEIGK
ncbi:MAG: RNA polymerase sigma factor [Candidatus Pacebacteria bacterium]|nr:RNA polymerase sigma factor [Candidatus Paceibacterota bacterium]